MYTHNPDEPTTLYVVYHAPCKDGFTAAWIAWMLWKYGDDVTAIDYCAEHTSTYPRTHELLDHPDIQNCTVLFLDVCPPRELLEALHEKSLGCLVIDHHLTTEQNCGDLDYVIVDKDECGASLFWKFLESWGVLPQEMPFLVQLVKDSDLFRWEIPHSQEFNIWLETIEFNFSAWDNAAVLLDEEDARQEILVIAQHYQKYRTHTLDRITTRRKIHRLQIGGHSISVVNSPIYQTPLGHRLAQRDKLHTAAVYYHDGDLWRFSLRSTKDGLNVAEIAEMYGGGGHKHAAGFTVESLGMLALTPTPKLADNLWPAFKDLPEEEIPEDDIY